MILLPAVLGLLTTPVMASDEPRCESGNEHLETMLLIDLTIVELESLAEAVENERQCCSDPDYLAYDDACIMAVCGSDEQETIRAVTYIGWSGVAQLSWPLEDVFNTDLQALECSNDYMFGMGELAVSSR